MHEVGPLRTLVASLFFAAVSAVMMAERGREEQNSREMSLSGAGYGRYTKQRRALAVNYTQQLMLWAHRFEPARLSVAVTTATHACRELTEC